MDGTLVGGKKRNVGSGSKKGKTWVAGATQRDTGQIRVERIQNIRRHTLHEFIRRNIRDEAEAIYTDELKSYIGIGDSNTRHETVSHSTEKWVVGDVHTNGIEGVWSLFKRSIAGSFHKISVKHLDRYLEELEWRFNNRKNPQIFHDTIEADSQYRNLDLQRIGGVVISRSFKHLTHRNREITASRKNQ